MSGITQRPRMRGGVGCRYSYPLDSMGHYPGKTCFRGTVRYQYHGAQGEVSKGSTRGPRAARLHWMSRPSRRLWGFCRKVPGLGSGVKFFGKPLFPKNWESKTSGVVKDRSGADTSWSHKWPNQEA